jgi:hypothetical protein
MSDSGATRAEWWTDEVADVAVWQAVTTDVVQTKTGPIDGESLGLLFHTSTFGQYMDYEQPLRYAEYSYGDAAMLKDLGSDIHPLGHQVKLSEYAAKLIAYEWHVGNTLVLDPRKFALARFICTIHDIGESTHPEVLEAVGAVVGDIPYGQKTDEQRAIEGKVLDYFLGTTFRHVPLAFREEAEATIKHQETGQLHDLYEFAHNALAYDTTERAGQLVAEYLTTQPRNDRMITNLARLHQNGRARLLPHLQAQIGIYNAAAQYEAA